MRLGTGWAWVSALGALVVLGGCASGASSTGVATSPGPDESATTNPAPTTASTTSITATSTTTSTTMSTIPTASPRSSAPVTRWHFAGDHSGTEHFALHTGRCAFLDHHLVETFTVSDGGTWQFDAVYCGTIDSNNVWTGQGTFLMDAGVGSAFSGHFTDSAQLPSTGVPYVLQVDAGQGEFSGVTGRCQLDNHLRSEEFGTQQQWGTFVCDLVRAAQ